MSATSSINWGFRDAVKQRHLPSNISSCRPETQRRGRFIAPTADSSALIGINLRGTSEQKDSWKCWTQVYSDGLSPSRRFLMSSIAQVSDTMQTILTSRAKALERASG